MQSDFQLFGPLHLAIIAAIPALAAGLARPARSQGGVRRTIAIGLGCVLLVNELIWWTWRIRHEGWRYPEGMPLQLCDLSLWSTITALLLRRQWPYELAWFAGIAGAGMAVLTPDLWAPTYSYPTAYFFLAHGLLISGVLYLTWSGELRPRPGCVWRAWAMVNAFAVLVGIFNAVHGTNYFYLCRKPGGASILDFLGPWPVYLLAVEVVTLFLFWLLWLPFRKTLKA